jgi:hypothetical protein
MSDEADKLEKQMHAFCYDQDGTIEWTSRAAEIEAIEKLTFK